MWVSSLSILKAETRKFSLEAPPSLRLASPRPKTPNPKPEKLLQHFKPKAAAGSNWEAPPAPRGKTLGSEHQESFEGLAQGLGLGRLSAGFENWDRRG